MRLRTRLSEAWIASITDRKDLPQRAETERKENRSSKTLKDFSSVAPWWKTEGNCFLTPDS